MTEAVRLEAIEIAETHGQGAVLTLLNMVRHYGQALAAAAEVSREEMQDAIER